jgi:signal peptidase I
MPDRSDRDVPDAPSAEAPRPVEHDGGRSDAVHDPLERTGAGPESAGGDPPNGEPDRGGTEAPRQPSPTSDEPGPAGAPGPEATGADPGAVGEGSPQPDSAEPGAETGAAAGGEQRDVAADRGSGQGKGERSSGSSFLKELPVLLLVAFVLAFLLRTFVVQVFYIPSSSMEETLQVNDRMAVEKITYLFRDPQRGEIVVFEGEDLGEVDPDATLPERAVRGVGQFLGVVPASARDFVKRVIGLPGDEVFVDEDGQVFVNDEPLDEPYVSFEDPSEFGPVTVPDGTLFFLGDNRPNSSDSRRSLGFVPVDAVVGRSAAVIWPPDNVGSLGGVEHEVPPADGAAVGDAEEGR